MDNVKFDGDNGILVDTDGEEIKCFPKKKHRLATDNPGLATNKKQRLSLESEPSLWESSSSSGSTNTEETDATVAPDLVQIATAVGQAPVQQACWSLQVVLAP